MECFEKKVQKLYEEKYILGITKFSRMWLIPKEPEKLAGTQKILNEPHIR